MRGKERIGVGLIGAGTVGGGVIRELNKYGEDLGLDLRAVLIDNPEKPREFEAHYTTNEDELFEEPGIDVVIELMGGTDEARRFATRAIEEDKSLITANKALLAEDAKVIFDAARARGLDVGFEASVAGIIPIGSLLRHFQGQRIKSIRGEFNGTSNYVLTRREEDQMSQEDAIKDAEAKGFAEKDSSRDIKGDDATDKIVLVASLAFNTAFDRSQIQPVGIDIVTDEDIKIAKMLGMEAYIVNGKLDFKIVGYSIRSISQAVLYEDETVEISTSPTLVRKDNPLASVRNENNGITIETENGNPITIHIQGPGAGRDATTSAVMADLIRISNNRRRRVADNLPMLDGNYQLRDPKKATSKWYIRLKLKDEVGSIEVLSRILREQNLSMEHSIQGGISEHPAFKSDYITLHEATEEQVIFASEALGKSDRVTDEVFRLRRID